MSELEQEQRSILAEMVRERDTEIERLREEIELHKSGELTGVCDRCERMRRRLEWLMRHSMYDTYESVDKEMEADTDDSK